MFSAKLDMIALKPISLDRVNYVSKLVDAEKKTGSGPKNPNHYAKLRMLTKMLQHERLTA